MANKNGESEIYKPRPTWENKKKDKNMKTWVNIGVAIFKMDSSEVSYLFFYCYSQLAVQSRIYLCLLFKDLFYFCGIVFHSWKQIWSVDYLVLHFHALDLSISLPSFQFLYKILIKLLVLYSFYKVKINFVCIRIVALKKSLTCFRFVIFKNLPGGVKSCFIHIATRALSFSACSVVSAYIHFNAGSPGPSFDILRWDLALALPLHFYQSDLKD